MKQILLKLLLFGVMFAPQAWGQNACRLIAESADRFYQVMPSHIAVSANQSPPPGLVVDFVAAVGQWRVYKTEQDFFTAICGVVPLLANDPLSASAYPVFYNLRTQNLAVFNGQFLIRANDNAKLEVWRKQFGLSLLLRMSAHNQAIFQVADDEDWGRFLDQFQRQVGVEQITPLLNEQLYRSR